MFTVHCMLGPNPYSPPPQQRSTVSTETAAVQAGAQELVLESYMGWLCNLSCFAREAQSSRRRGMSKHILRSVIPGFGPRNYTHESSASGGISYVRT